MASMFSDSHSRGASRAMSRQTSVTPRIVSGRSRLRTATTSIGGHGDNNIICAVSEARGVSPTVGLSFVNLSTSEAVLCQFADTQTYARTCHKIRVFQPTEILFASTAAKSKLLHVVRENLKVRENGIEMVEVDRRYWSEVAGHEYILQLAFVDDLEPLKASSMASYFANCCFGAVMKYVSLSIGIDFAPCSLRIRFEASEGALMIDVSTITSLELVQNILDAKSKDCLYGLLNATQTRMGARMLKNNILQPSTNREKISRRYDAVAELSSREEVFALVREALREFMDTDKVLAAIVIHPNKIDINSMEHSVNTVVMLKSFIDMIKPVWLALAGATCEELQSLHSLFDPGNYGAVQEALAYALNDDVRYSTKPTELRNQRIWALNAGVNGFLDIARQTYKEIETDIHDMIRSLGDEHEFNLELKYDPARQFFIKMKGAEVGERDLPEVFINVYQNRTAIECQTMDLLKMNQKLRDAHNEVIAMSDGSIQELLANVRPAIYPLFKISEGIALLDMLCSFAQAAIDHGYVKPELTSTFAVQAGRHPIRERSQQEHFVPNDVYATQQSRFQIITGCNMSGKSTYIRSIALLTIMAQIGCFVPANYASFTVVHQIFARVSTDDNIGANVSTFASEMREMAFILHNIEPHSLVVIDELGRGTSTTDGLSIAIAICEALIESGALVWFVTHFRDLPKILAERAGVVSLHLAVDISDDLSQMKMMYKICSGAEEQKLYGIALAQLVDMPSHIIEHAATISQRLHHRTQSHQQDTRTLGIARKRRLVLKLKEQLIQTIESELDKVALQRWFKRLQEEFIVRMGAIDAEMVATASCDDSSSVGGDEASAGHIATASKVNDLEHSSSSPEHGIVKNHC